MSSQSNAVIDQSIVKFLQITVTLMSIYYLLSFYPTVLDHWTRWKRMWWDGVPLCAIWNASETRGDCWQGIDIQSNACLPIYWYQPVYNYIPHYA